MAAQNLSAHRLDQALEQTGVLLFFSDKQLDSSGEAGISAVGRAFFQVVAFARFADLESLEYPDQGLQMSGIFGAAVTRSGRLVALPAPGFAPTRLALGVYCYNHPTLIV